MKLTPSSTARRSTSLARPGSTGEPQIPSPVSRIAPNPRRRTSRSPPKVMVPAAEASVVSRATLARYPRGRRAKPALFLLVRERELHVGTGDSDERAGLRRAAVQRRELGVDHRDEVEVAAVKVFGEGAAIAVA